MKCNKCHAEWTPPKDRTITHCPFCSEPLYELKLESHPAKPHELLCQIVNQFDREVLGKRQLKGMLSDFMPNTERKYLRIFKQAVTDGIGSDLLKLTTETEAARIMKIITLKNKFKQNNGFSDASDYVVDCFLYALGWMTSVPEERNTNKPGVDTLSVINRQMELAFADRSLTREASQALFLLAKSLNIPEQQVANLIDQNIKVHKLTPKNPVKASLTHLKEVICSTDWTLINQKLEKEALGISSDYGSIKIGKQEWMTRNLDVTHFRNGDIIPEVRTNDEWVKVGKEGKPAWCYYNNDSENAKSCGKLYNSFAVNDPRGLAPKGWHIPDNKEWQEMVDFLGGEYKASKKLKSVSGWGYNNEENGTNESGFSALPCGRRHIDGKFEHKINYCYWWASKDNSSLDAWYRRIAGFSERLIFNSNYETYGFSVRCIMTKK